MFKIHISWRRRAVLCSDLHINAPYCVDMKVSIWASGNCVNLGQNTNRDAGKSSAWSSQLTVTITTALTAQSNVMNGS